MNQNRLPSNYPAIDLLKQTPLSLVITDLTVPDNPIIFINKAFEQTTGYSESVTLGRNCRFLQGRDTDQSAVRRIRDAIETRSEAVVTILNYRSDGEPFWNELNLAPIFATDGTAPYFIGIQRVVPGPEGKQSENVSQDLMLQEIQHRVKNHLAMVVSLIRSQARVGHDNHTESFITLARRVEALQLLYEQLNLTASKHDIVDIGSYAGQVVAAVTHLNGARGIRVNTDIDYTEVSVDLAVQVGLILSEVLTNSFQHAFRGRSKGVVSVSIKVIADRRIAMTVTDDGVGMSDPDKWPSLGGSGSRIVKGMIDFADADVNVTSDNSGTKIVISFPQKGTNGGDHGR